MRRARRRRGTSTARRRPTHGGRDRRRRSSRSTAARTPASIARLTSSPPSFITPGGRSEVRPISWIGKSLLRYEDPEFLTGNGRYIADVVRPGMLDAVFLRSPHPHARIRGVDTSAALALDGVRAVLTGADLPADLGPQPCNHLFDGQRETPYFALARERVRYVGEPVAIVVADSPYVAEDACELIAVEWEELPSVGNVGAALAGEAPRLYDDWPDNVAATFEAERSEERRVGKECSCQGTARHA